MSTVVPVTSMRTWLADDGPGLEGVRLLLGAGGFRALGRLVRPGFTASYRLIVDDDGAVSRVSLTSATEARERHLTLNRTEDGYWLLDRGAGNERRSFGGAVDVDLAYSPMFNTLPIRRLGLHRETGAHAVPMVTVTLPELDVELVEQQYRTVSTLNDAGHAVIAFSWDAFAADLVVDADAVVLSYPGVATQIAVSDAVHRG